jgi:general secretion pathway protein E/type IV pilus assembly protein PilB
VFSTLHTNDAPGAITRLIDMGIKPFLVAAATRAILAQRLVRRFCGRCVSEHVLTEGEKKALDLTDEDMKDARPMIGPGCRYCDGNGYKGRMGLFEVLELNDGLRRLVIEGKPAGELREAALEADLMKTLRVDGVRKVLTGMTSVSEVIRVTSSDEG